MKECEAKLSEFTRKESKVDDSDVQESDIKQFKQQGYGNLDFQTEVQKRVDKEEFHTPAANVVLPSVGVTEPELKTNPEKNSVPAKTIVKSVERKRRGSALKLIKKLKQHSSQVTWNSEGDLYIDDDPSGNLYELLPITFSGPISDVEGAAEWFKLLNKLKLQSFILNKGAHKKLPVREEASPPLVSTPMENWYKI